MSPSGVNYQAIGFGLYSAIGETEPLQSAQDEECGNGVDIRQDQGEVINGKRTDGTPGGGDHGEGGFL